MKRKLGAIVLFLVLVIGGCGEVKKGQEIQEETQEREIQEKETQEKETQEKETQERETQEKETQEKETQEQELHHDVEMTEEVSVSEDTGENMPDQTKEIMVDYVEIEKQADRPAPEPKADDVPGSVLGENSAENTGEDHASSEGRDTGNIQNSGNKENGGNGGNVGNTESPGNIESAGNVENDENVESAVDKENAGNVENDGSAGNTENTENTGNTENVWNTENSETEGGNLTGGTNSGDYEQKGEISVRLSIPVYIQNDKGEYELFCNYIDYGYVGGNYTAHASAPSGWHVSRADSGVITEQNTTFYVYLDKD